MVVVRGQPALALCLEQTLGHRAHGLNLEAAAPEAGAHVVRVPYPEVRRVPVPWAVRGSLQAARAVRALPTPPDVTLFHTSTIGLGARQVPGRYVISLDATPAQYDSMGGWYGHRRGPRLAEAAKRRLYGSTFRHAAAIVTWSEWTARSLGADYGVDRGRITVVHPGAPSSFFSIPRPGPGGDRPNVLFVGGDVRRKGLDVLLEAFRPLAGRCRLTIVTDAAVEPASGVAVLPGIRPGTAAQFAAYADADIFCLPTRGDCTSVAIEEAMAAGLPVVTTPVGSNGETVRQGETGLLVPVDDADALRAALAGLIEDGAYRARLGNAARARAREEMDAGANARRILALMKEVA